MAWMLMEVLDTNADINMFSDSELMALCTAIRERVQTPYDDESPAFTAYTKLRNNIKGTR
jgi:hypothetical protein